MTCDQTQPLLEAFTDGELGWGKARRVRRHLAECPACAAELAEVRQLDARVRAWRDVPAPAGLQGRVAAALASAPPASVPRRPVAIRRVGVGLACLAVTLAAFFWLVPGQPGRPAFAFADVEQAMQQVQTLSWVSTSYYTDRRGNKISGYVGLRGNKVSTTEQVVHTWLRRRPAAIGTLAQRNGWRILTDKRGGLVRTGDGHYQTLEANRFTEKDAADQVEHEIRRMTQSPDASPKSGGTSSGTAITGYKSGHAESSQFHSTSMPVHEHQVVLNGHVQVLFTRDANIIFTTYPAPFKVVHIKKSVWADSATHRITQIEIQNSGGGLGPNVRAVVVYNHFLYNQSPPPGTFDWSPPPGTKREGPEGSQSAQKKPAQKKKR